MKVARFIIPAILAVVSTSFGADATQPSATSPKRLSTPAGCMRIETNGRTLITDTADADWVRKAAEQAPPGTPTTQPSDLLTRLHERRPILAKTMLTDLPMLKPADVDAFIDTTLQPELETLAQVKAYPVFLVVSDSRLTEIVRQGWTEPHLHLNRETESVEIDHGVTVQPKDPTESVVVVTVDPKQTLDDRALRLADTVSRMELSIRQNVTARTTVSLVQTCGKFLARNVFAKLPHGTDQLWFGTGLTNVLAARYIAIIHGAPFPDFVAEMVRTLKPGPIDDNAVNLLHPFDASDLKPELVEPYGQACYRKSIAVMFLWMNRAGTQSIAPLVDSIDKLPPADGPTLVKLIANTTGIDLTEILTGRLKPI